MNTLIVGQTQSGKSTAEVRRLTKWNGATVICDPHRFSLGWKYAEYMACKKKPFVFDDLKQTDLVLGWTFLQPSSGQGIDAEVENETRGRDFADILCRRRGLDLSKTPLIEEWAIAAIKLWMCQEEPKPLSDLVYAFQPRTPQWASLVGDCKDTVADKFKVLRRYSPMALRGEVGPAQRLFEATLLSPAFMIRSGGGFDFRSVLDQKGTIIIQGDPENKNATRMILSAVILQIIRYARTSPNAVRLVVDEANNFELIGRPELESLAQDQKNKLDWDILVQSLDFPDQKITDGVITNCQRHEWFRCAADTSKTAAQDLGISSLDPYKVHHVDSREKQLHDGYDYENMKTSSRQTGRSTNDVHGTKAYWEEQGKMNEGFTETELEQARARYRTVHEDTVHYEHLNDQILMMQQKVMTQAVGHRWVREGGKVFEEQVKMVKAHVWPRVAQKRAKAAITQSIGEHGIKPSLPSTTNTPSRSSKQSGSDSSTRSRKGAATRLLGDDSTD